MTNVHALDFARTTRIAVDSGQLNWNARSLISVFFRLGMKRGVISFRLTREGGFPIGWRGDKKKKKKKRREAEILDLGNAGYRPRS